MINEGRNRNVYSAFWCEQVIQRICLNGDLVNASIHRFFEGLEESV